VTVEQVVVTQTGQVADAHPTQTVQETVDSLEMVRQLFEAGVLQSGFWHQFMTAHSQLEYIQRIWC
jgi:hypothetical protein